MNSVNKPVLLIGLATGFALTVSYLIESPTILILFVKLCLLCVLGRVAWAVRDW